MHWRTRAAKRSTHLHDDGTESSHRSSPANLGLSTRVSLSIFQADRHVLTFMISASPMVSKGSIPSFASGKIEPRFLSCLQESSRSFVSSSCDLMVIAGTNKLKRIHHPESWIRWRKLLFVIFEVAKPIPYDSSRNIGVLGLYLTTSFRNSQRAQQSPMKSLMKVIKPKKSLGFSNGEDRI